MNDLRTDASLRLEARIAGGLYLIVIVTAGFAEAFARGKVIVSGDAAATAANILAHETFYRLGGAADMLNLACDIAVAILLYDLLRPVSKTIALLSSVYKLVGDGVTAVATLEHFAPLVFLSGQTYLNVFSTEQLHAQAMASVRLHSQAYNIAMVFFGFNCLLLGYVVYKSTFLPRLIGVFLSVAGVCYALNSFARFLSPAFAAHLFPYILWPGLLGEWSLALWLTVFGINIPRWKARAAARPGVTANEWATTR